MTSQAPRDAAIGSVMQTSVVSTDASVTLREAAQSLKIADVGTLVVMEGPDVVGVVSERDLVRALADGADPEQVRVADIMTKDPRYVTLGDSVGAALGIMLTARVRHLPIVDDGELIGMVSIRDLATTLLR